MRRNRPHRRYGHAFNRRGGAKPDRKAAWMRAFEDEALLRGAPHGHIRWEDAQYLFGQGVDPVEAARRVYK